MINVTDEEVTAVGVDGWRGGWVAAELRGDRISWRELPTFAEVLRTYERSAVAVDIPLQQPLLGARACELEAKAFLGPARSSIFLTPQRWVLTAYRSDGPHPVGIGVTRQTWNLLPKIAEVDAALDHSGRQRVAEAHPECSFRAMAGATKVDPHPSPAYLDSKKTGRGVGQRLRLLAAAAGFQLPGLVEAPPGPAVDDLLDAAAAAWTARRWRTGSEELIRFGTPAQGEILA